MRKKILILASIMLVFASFIGIVLARQTDAKVRPPVEDETKVLICHFDNNVKKPYGPKAIDVSISSILNEEGHSDHTGPIAVSEAVAQALKDDHKKWGDIIPPFSYGKDGKLNFEGLNYTNIGQAMLENDCQFVTEIISVAVTFEAPTCDARELYTYIIPAVDHVSYYLGDSETPLAADTYSVAVGTSVSIKAVADKGFYLSGDTEWVDPEFEAKTEEECAEAVIATAITFTNPTCDVLGTYTIPAKTGVEYRISDVVVPSGIYDATDNSTLTITAKALTGYKLEGTAEWTHTFTAPAAEDCVQGASTVAPTAVTFTDPTCEVLGTYTIKATKGVKYFVDGIQTTAGTYSVANGKTVVVTAAAEEGYSIDSAVTTKWTHTFTAPSCVLGASTTTPTTLPVTSSDGTLANITIFSLVAGFVTLIGYAVRGIFARQF